jgi:hypothetical protein
MTIRRATAAISTVLLVLLSVAVAEAALLVLIVVFSSILRLQLGAQVGQQFLQLWTNAPSAVSTPMASMTLHQAAIAGSCVVTLVCAGAAVVHRHRQWKPV